MRRRRPIFWGGFGARSLAHCRYERTAEFVGRTGGWSDWHEVQTDVKGQGCVAAPVALGGLLPLLALPVAMRRRRTR